MLFISYQAYVSASTMEVMYACMFVKIKRYAYIFMGEANVSVLLRNRRDEIKKIPISRESPLLQDIYKIREKVKIS